MEFVAETAQAFGDFAKKAETLGEFRYMKATPFGLAPQHCNAAGLSPDTPRPDSVLPMLKRALLNAIRQFISL